jgi:hypothetical protein
MSSLQELSESLNLKSSELQHEINQIKYNLRNHQMQKHGLVLEERMEQRNLNIAK